MTASSRPTAGPTEIRQKRLNDQLLHYAIGCGGEPARHRCCRVRRDQPYRPSCCRVPRAARVGAGGLCWAAAARDGAKVKRVLATEGVKPPETILAEVGDPSSLRAMASRAIVVLNLVGPYMLYGESVIEACVDAGCHYVDLTGEIRVLVRLLPGSTNGIRAGAAPVDQLL
jgi:Saccharopine dehydrogenase NADP binding domain